MITSRILAKRFNVTPRTIQLVAKELNISKYKGKYLFSKDEVGQIQSALNPTIIQQTKRNEIKRNTNLEDLEATLKDVKRLVKQMDNQIQILKTKSK